MKNAINILALVAITALPLVLFPDRAPGPPEAGAVRSVVSLSPSITAAIVDLGAADLLVGVSYRHPPLSRSVEVVGDLARVDMERIVALDPDIVFFSAEDGATQMADRVRAIGVAAHRFGRNRDFDDICAHYIDLGDILGRGARAREQAGEYRRQLGRIARAPEAPRVALFISHEPLIPAGGGSFVGRIIEAAGGRNAFGGIDRPFPVVSAEHLVLLDPDIIVSIAAGPRQFFSSGAFRRMRATRRGAVRRIDADLVGTYTPRSFVAAAAELRRLIADAGKS
ncbi:MAG TPA: helical backbone metal receptor [Spirochaetota bacterium]|nr:helical backbone metal receptor [Spirochaetota bacterium]